MSWIETTKLKYISQPTQIGVRTYTYEFREKWWSFLQPFKTLLGRDFQTKELAVNGDANGHHMVLINPDFEINGINIIEWARNTISKGRVTFEFTVTYELMSGTNSLLYMEARFSDPRIATLFKLTFG